MLMRRRKALISFDTPERSELIHPEVGGDSGWKWWIPGDKRTGNSLPQEPPALEGSCGLCGRRSHPALSPQDLKFSIKLEFQTAGSEPLAKGIPEPAISSKNWNVLRNHRVASHKSQIIQTRWEKWGILRHFSFS